MSESPLSVDRSAAHQAIAVAHGFPQAGRHDLMPERTIEMDPDSRKHYPWACNTGFPPQ